MHIYSSERHYIKTELNRLLTVISFAVLKYSKIILQLITITTIEADSTVKLIIRLELSPFKIDYGVLKTVVKSKIASRFNLKFTSEAHT